MVDTVATGPLLSEPQDQASLDKELAGFWIDELASYDKAYNPWCRRVEKIIKKYRDERYINNSGSNDSGYRRYAILWSNVETIKPAIYARPPKAVVGRRWKDRDPTGRLTALILERAENFSIDCYDLDGTMKECVTDYLLAGRGQIWVRYEPTFKQVPIMAPAQAAAGDGVQAVGAPAPAAASPTQLDEQGNLVDELSYEQTCRDYVAWEDFSHSVSRIWKEVWWVGRRTFQTRKQLIARFGRELGDRIPLDWGPEKNQTTGRFEKRSKAAIYEIWSKRDRKIYWISRAFGERPLAVSDPLYKLNDFFPCPKPCYATLTNESLIPVPDYIYYQDQAEEIDQLTARIGKLTDALKLVGVYAGNSEVNIQLGKMLSPQTDMQMIPVENWAMFADSKGIGGLIDWFPVDQVIKVLEGCIKLRAQLIQDIYQITGISDIVRGASDPNETATAQQIKNRWGGLRVRDRQAEVQRFARDVIRIESEIVAQQFQPQTLSLMTGVELPTNADKAQVQQEMALQAQAAARQAAMQQQMGPNGQPMPPQQPQATEPPEPTPEQKHILESPSWEDVMALMRNNELRDFRIDVETDSTIQPDEDEEKQKRTELLEVVGKYMEAIATSPPALIPVMNELLLFTVRAFHAGNSVEDAIDEAMSAMGEQAKQPQPPQPDPLVIKAETESKIKEAQAAQDLQHKGQAADADIQIKKALAATDIEIMRAKGTVELQHHAAQSETKAQQMRANGATGGTQ
jgi:hypothetical protein